MSIIAQSIQTFLKRKSVKYGLPFLVLIVGGSFGLKEFTKLRYQFAKVSVVKPEEFKKRGIDMKKSGEVTIDTEFEKIQKLDIDNWEQVRGPRPWEENTNQ